MATSTKLASTLVSYLKSKHDNDFEKISEFVSRYSEKAIPAEKFFYIWKADTTIKKWMITAISMAAIESKWLPEEKTQAEQLLWVLTGNGNIDTFEPDEFKVILNCIPGLVESDYYETLIKAINDLA